MADQRNDTAEEPVSLDLKPSKQLAAPDGNNDPARRDDTVADRERPNQDDPSRAPESGDRS